MATKDWSKKTSDMPVGVRRQWRADNALAESFNATLKREVLRDRKLFESPISCRQEIFRWCMRYNTRRRHS
ncbi:hypothetical protein B1A61_08415 [Corynebacterium diphtheriae]|nr:hypothetical protein B1A61_08415 [Corynebacterium diphtheriae]